MLAGADKVSINTAAVRDRRIVAEASEKFGAQAIVVAIDAKKVSRDGDSRWEIFTHGGRNPTGLDAVDYAVEVARLGAGEILLTSMDRDGTGDGFDLGLTRAIADAVPVPVVASGGVGRLDHLVDGVNEGMLAGLRLYFPFGDLVARSRSTWRRSASRCASMAEINDFTLADRAKIIAERARSGDPGSYTAKLVGAGVGKRAKKFGEEAVEAALAAVAEDDAALTAEAADVLYHLLVMLEARSVARRCHGGTQEADREKRSRREGVAAEGEGRVMMDQAAPQALSPVPALHPRGVGGISARHAADPDRGRGEPASQRSTTRSRWTRSRRSTCRSPGSSASTWRPSRGCTPRPAPFSDRRTR